MPITLSVIKADVGSIGGHTRPSDAMLASLRQSLRETIGSGLLVDGTVTHTGDDMAIIMSHRHGVGAERVHQFAWNCFLQATAIDQVAGEEIAPGYRVIACRLSAGAGRSVG